MSVFHGPFVVGLGPRATQVPGYTFSRRPPNPCLCPKGISRVLCPIGNGLFQPGISIAMVFSGKAPNVQTYRQPAEFEFRPRLFVEIWKVEAGGSMVITIALVVIHPRQPLLQGTAGQRLPPQVRIDANSISRCKLFVYSTTMSPTSQFLLRFTRFPPTTNVSTIAT